MDRTEHAAERIEDLENALEKALHGWESCLRFKGSYLVKMDKDDKIINDLRKLLNGN